MLGASSDDDSCWAWDVCFNEVTPMTDELKQGLKEFGVQSNGSHSRRQRDS